MPARSQEIRILSMLQLLGQPRDSKRIAMLQQAGFTVEVAAFERRYHSGRMPSCPITRLGVIEHGQYVQRVLRLISAIPRLRQAMKRHDLVYASGQDMAYLALVASLGLDKPVVLEVGDINRLQVAPGIKGFAFRLIDKLLTSRCSLLVSTAPKFVSEYYRKWLGVDAEALVLENKLESDFIKELDKADIDKPTKLEEMPLVDRPVRIGYFGLLRCQWCWEVLQSLASSRPQDVEIILAGYPMKPADLLSQVEKHHNIKYLGEYRSPQDLPALYGGIDLVWACYEPIGPNDWNLRWARTNRFYESCFFQRPIISRSGSCDSVDVESYGIGLVIKDENVDKVTSVLSNIGSVELEKWQKNIAALPLSVYTYTYEQDMLKSAVEQIVKNAAER